MKNQIQKNSIILISSASIAYTLWFYSGALVGIKEGNVVGPNAFYPWLVALEGIILLLAAAIPLLSAFRPSILKIKPVRWVGVCCISFGILISINFFMRMNTSFTPLHVKVALRLVSWCALAFLTYWTLQNTRANKSQVDNA
jgi:uncharacterized membrane protein